MIKNKVNWLMNFEIIVISFLLLKFIFQNYSTRNALTRHKHLCTLFKTNKQTKNEKVIN